jgi:hypothetical protein
MRLIQSSPDMSASEKRAKMDELETQRNELFRTVVGKLNAVQLEQYRDRLDGIPQ